MLACHPAHMIQLKEKGRRKMSSNVCYCKNCTNEKYYHGWFPYKDGIDFCPVCGAKLEKTSFSDDDFMDLALVNNSDEFFRKMLTLHDTEPGKYEFQMTIYREKANEIRAKIRADQHKIRCPRCGSPDVRTGVYRSVFLSAFIGPGAPRNICKNCGLNWKQK